ncbi:MAG TPA: sortase [Dehalococcoidia bacterium]|nr:sortase [Dehalococcoidia bacterium]
MEAGYDYLLFRGKRHLFGLTPLFLAAFGALLLAGGGAYYAYAAKARADLDQLNVSAPEPARTFLDHQGTQGPLDSSDPSSATVGAAEPVSPPPGISDAAIANQQLYAADPLAVEAWSNPLGYEPLDYREHVLLQGFTPMKMEEALPVGSQAATTQIMIPSLGIDSSVRELEILDLTDSRAYETPANNVGHIPSTANAGEAGSSWFFGHLESPITGEGSVFFHLPKIAEMLRNDEEIFVITDNGAHQYLYRVISTNVVHQNDMKLYDKGEANIHLVACVPRLVYDHRIIVTGELVGVK